MAGFWWVKLLLRSLVNTVKNVHGRQQAASLALTFVLVLRVVLFLSSLHGHPECILCLDAIGAHACAWARSVYTSACSMNACFPLPLSTLCL